MKKSDGPPTYDPFLGWGGHEPDFFNPKGSPVPILRAERIRDEYRVWCVCCRRWHYHGALDGGRVAHCVDVFTRGRNRRRLPPSIYLHTGYILRGVDHEAKKEQACR